MDASPPGPSPPSDLETTLAVLDGHLAEVERAASSLLKATRRARRAAQEGAIAALPATLAAARAEVARIAAPLAAAEAAPGYDVAEAFSSGAWLDELAAAARAAGVVLVRRDGRVTAFPVALQLDARAQGVRIGRRLERRLHPRIVAAQLRALQQRPDRFNARQFLDRLFRLYASHARAEDPRWRPTHPGEGPLVALAELHEQLTVLPAAAADYPSGAFATDLLRLDRQPDATTGQGHRFELGGSTGRKGAKRITLFDEQGEQHDYFAIRFILDASHGRADDAAAAAR